MADPIVFDRFNPPGDDGVDCSGDPGRTQQEFKDEVDINRIMGRVIAGAQLPPDMKVASFGDYSAVPDFQASLELIKRARAQFEALPAAVRDGFENDPVRFLNWVHDPATTLEDAEKLGILKDEVVAKLERDRTSGVIKVPAGGVVTETVKTS